MNGQLTFAKNDGEVSLVKKMTAKIDACPLCGGKKEEGSTTFTVDLKETLVVVRDVPATLCAQCYNEWLSDKTASTLEKIVQDAKKKVSFGRGHQIH